MVKLSPQNKKFLQDCFTKRNENRSRSSETTRLIGNWVFSPIYFPFLVLPIMLASARFRRDQKKKHGKNLVYLQDTLCELNRASEC